MATLPKKPVKVAIYCRQSDLGKKAIAGMDKSLSLETQLAHCQAYCEQHGFLVVGTYSEQITEEVFDGRPALTRMIGTKIDAIICYKYDRIIRDPMKRIVFVQAMRSKGVRVLSATEPEFEADEMGDMMHFIMGTMAKVGKAQMIARSIDTKNKLMDSGLLLCHGKAQYGYAYDRKNRTRVIVESEAEVVRKIFAYVIDGMSLRQIADRLNSEGVKGPEDKWNPATLSTTLNNPSYYGERFIANRRTPVDRRMPSGKRADAKNTPDLFKFIGEPTPIIIDRVTWDKAHLRLKDRTKRPTAKLKIWLRGHVKCGHCGGRMTPNGESDERTWRCFKSDCKESKPFKLTMVEAAVWSKVLKACSDRKYLSARIAEAIAKVDRPDYELQLSNRQARIKELQSEVDILVNQLSKSKHPVVRESIDKHINAKSEEIDREHGLCREIESILFSSREQKAMLREVSEALTNLEVIAEADDDQKGRIARSLGLAVYLTVLSPEQFAALPASEQKEHRENLKPGPRDKALKTISIFMLIGRNPSSEPLTWKSDSVKRKFVR